MNRVAGIIAIVFLTAAAALTLASPSVLAARVQFFDNENVYLTGPIELRDDIAFITAVRDGTNVKRVVRLDSGGGKVDVAIAIADAIRTMGYATAASAECASACVLIWAAGRPHTLRGRLGVHCARLVTSPLECDALVNQELVDYLLEVRAPKRLIELQASAGPEIVWVDEHDLEEEAVPLPRPRPEPSWAERLWRRVGRLWLPNIIWTPAARTRP